MKRGPALWRRALFTAVGMASGRGYWGTVLRRLQDLERSQWWAEERIAEYQVVRLQQLVSHAGRAVPFYRARFRQIGLEPGDIRSLGEFAGIPPLTRQEVRANLADLVAEGWQGRVQENSTGGSCGQPVRFFIDAGESALRAAMAARHNRWAGWDLGARAGVIWGAPRDLAGRQPIRERLAARLLTPTLSFNAFDVTPAQLARFAVTLRDWRAEVLFGYAAALAEFARALQNSGETTSSLRTIVSSAEALTPQNRGLIEEATGCPIFDRYGARETGLIASECEVRRGMHVACEDVYVEVESPAPGESGRVLVTKLNSFGMPFIRYDIGDMGYWERVECPCGRCLPLLRLVGCRATDFLVAADGRLVSGAALTLVTRDLPELGTVQLHQSALGRVEVRIEGGGVLPEETADEVRRRLTTYLGPVTVEFAYPARIERTQSGKYRFTVCEVRPEPAAVSKHFGFLD